MKAGLEILGFADHAPYIFPDGYYSTFRMRLEQLTDYVDTVLSLREEYKNRIEIPLGLEIEYYPRHLPELLPILRNQPMDYLILGQHFVNNEYDAPYNGVASDDEALLRQYVRQTCDAMNTDLQRLYDMAKDRYPLLMEQIHGHLRRNAPLGADFSVTFE